MEKIALLAALLCCRFIPYCQSEPLTVGDRFSDITTISDSARYYDGIRPDLANKRLILLDFWNVRCGNCIAAMPKMEALQNEFGNQVQIVLVTNNTADEVNSLFRKVRIAKPDLPMVVSDSAFNDRFPHDGDPLHVWLDSGLIVRHVTEGYNATKENIALFLRGEQPSIADRLPIKDFDYSATFLEGLGRAEANTQRYSVLLTGLANRLPWGSITSRVDSLTNTFYFRAINCTPVALFGAAYHTQFYGKGVPSLVDPDKNNRIICNASLRNPPDSGSLDEWGKQNLFCYELTVQTDSSNFYGILQQDLSTVLPFRASVEMRKTTCWVLKRRGKIVSEKSLPRPGAVFVSETKFYFSNLPMSRLVDYLQTINHLVKVPVVDETNYRKKLNLILPQPLYDITSLRQALGKYGFTIQEVERWLPVLAIVPKQ